MKIAIQGHPDKGKEVIQILESLGGNNYNCLNATASRLYYYNGNFNHIDYIHKELINRNIYKLYTLEEFEKEFPFKIGDKVTIISEYPYTIIALEYYMGNLCYKLDNGLHYDSELLTSYKEMKEERNITLTLDKAKEWYKKGGELKEVALQAYSEGELNPRPRSWEEFCEKYPVKSGECWLNGRNIIEKSSCSCERKYKNWIPSQKSAEAHLALIQLEQLRNCWWNGWEPIWDVSHKWCIRLWGNELEIGLTTNVSRFLTFPTKEMAEEFLECFRDLIELAKYLI